MAKKGQKKSKRPRGKGNSNKQGKLLKGKAAHQTRHGYRNKKKNKKSRKGAGKKSMAASNTLILRGSVFLGELKLRGTTYEPNMVTVFNTDINPTLFAGSRLAQMSIMYERYKFESAELVYTPTTGSQVGGQVISYFDTDVKDLISANRLTAINHARDCQQSKIFATRGKAVVKMPKSTAVKSFYTDLSDGQNRETTQAKVIVLQVAALTNFTGAAVDTSKGPVTVGTMDLRYTIRLITPQGLPSSVANSITDVTTNVQLEKVALTPGPDNYEVLIKGPAVRGFMFAQYDCYAQPCSNSATNTIPDGVFGRIDSGGTYIAHTPYSVVNGVPDDTCLMIVKTFGLERYCLQLTTTGLRNAPWDLIQQPTGNVSKLWRLTLSKDYAFDLMDKFTRLEDTTSYATAAVMSEVDTLRAEMEQLRLVMSEQSRKLMHHERVMVAGLGEQIEEVEDDSADDEESDEDC